MSLYKLTDVYFGNSQDHIDLELTKSDLKEIIDRIIDELYYFLYNKTNKVSIKISGTLTKNEE